MQFKEFGEGWLSDIESFFLSSVSSKCKSGNIVNIGCWKGKSLRAILSGNPTVPVYGIDIHLQRNALSDIQDSVNLIEMDSSKVTCFDSHSIEFLFVDGDHSCQGVSNDINVFWDYVMPGGLIMFHDVYPIHGFNHQPEIERAIFEHIMLSYRYNALLQDNFIRSPVHRIDTSLVIQKQR